jgi:hypothetical protein
MCWNSSSAHRTAFVLVEEAWVVRALLIAVVLHAVAQGHVPVASRNRMAVEVAHLAAVEYTVVVGDGRCIRQACACIDPLHVVGPVTLAERLSDVTSADGETAGCCVRAVQTHGHIAGSGRE